MTVNLAQSDSFDETTLLENADMFIVWDANWTGKVGTIVRDEGQLYQKINADFNAPFPQSKPSADASQWKRIGNPAEEWPMWVQPLGAHDAYPQGAKVKHKGKNWVSSLNGNIWEPGIYGWSEA